MKYHMRMSFLWPLLLLTGVMIAGCETSNATEPGTILTKSKAEIVMYKSEGCECCSKWAEHMRMAGFEVVEIKLDDMDAIKSQHEVSNNLSSCHTAIVDGYVIEGHVPAADVARLLRERPKVIGLTAPGMPMESPGMQEPSQIPRKYDVFAFESDGKSHLFTRYYADGKFREFTR